MDEESKKLSIEFLEKWTRQFNYYADVGKVFSTEEERREFVAGLNFILVALKGNIQIVHTHK